MPPPDTPDTRLNAGAADDLHRHVTPAEVPVRQLEVRESFESLTEDQRLYAHWMSVAGWSGARIAFAQSSPESPGILDLILRIFSLARVPLRRLASRHGLRDEAWNDILVYSARFLSNAGNYLGFGDTKFVPRCPPDGFDRLVAAAADLERGDSDALWASWRAVREAMYRLEPDDRRLAMPPTGRSCYYGEGVSQADAEAVSEYLRERGMEAWNTRLSRDPETRGLELRVASIESRRDGPFPLGEDQLTIVYGDHSASLRQVVAALREAARHAANDHQRAMIADYATHFEGGDVTDHKAAMRHWVRDHSPTIETNLGFIETYRDPLHVRAEWEGFVAIQDAEQTGRLQALVDRAPQLLERLPWPRDFERETFRRPDFTSLEVLSFAGSGIPAGINIPNYLEIRDSEGFKNVSLGNVLRSSRQTDGPISFLKPEDQDLYREKVADAFRVQVGLHELLGHGSGKLLKELPDGGFNFDPALVNPLTRRAVETWYRPGETWGSRFGAVAAPFEECRAEAVGLVLSLEDEVLEVFGHEGREAEDILYCNWLNMARAGVLALRFYEPEDGTWGQAHMRARFALLRVMLDADRDLLRLRERGESWIIELDRALLPTLGREVISEFLQRLHVYRCTGDAAGGTAFFDSWSRPDDWMLPLRDAVIANEKPRHLWVQAVTDLDHEGAVVLREYPVTHEGVIDSFVDRFGDRAAPRL